MPIHVFDTDVDESNVDAFLARCADNLPGDYKPDSHTWGDGAAAQLFRDSVGTPLRAKAVRVLEDFFERGNEEQLKLADLLMPPAEVDVRTLERALARPDLTKGQQSNLIGALGRAVTAQPREYQTSFRSYVGQGYWESMLGALVVSDHAWLMQNLPSVLGTDPDAAVNTLYSGVLHLRESEVRALRGELAADTSLPQPTRDALLAYLDDELSQGQLQARAGGVRWLGAP